MSEYNNVVMIHHKINNSFKSGTKWDILQTQHTLMFYSESLHINNASFFWVADHILRKYVL